MGTTLDTCGLSYSPGLIGLWSRVSSRCSSFSSSSCPLYKGLVPTCLAPLELLGQIMSFSQVPTVCVKSQFFTYVQSQHMAFTQIPSLNSPSPVKAKLFRLFRVGISAPAVLRLGFHDCLKYKDGTGGCDGCLNWHGMGVKSLFWIFLFYLNIQVAPI